MEMVTGVAIVIGVILVSMILHELAHGAVALWLGDETAKSEGRLSLNPVKHLDPFMSLILPVLLYLMGGPVFGGAKPVPINSRNLKFGAWGMALVAIAGPLTNFILAFLGFFIGIIAGQLFVQDGGLYVREGLSGTIFSQFVMVNLGFFVFNLIPVPPLDGSRVLYALAPDGARAVMDRIETMGVFLVFFIVMIFSGPISQFMTMVMQGVLDFFVMLCP